MALINLQTENAGYNGRNVLRDLTLSIEEGERIALVGESGAGKSTLLRLLYERCPAETALVPQNLGLVNALSVFHNVYMGRLHRNSTWQNLRNLVSPLKTELAEIGAILEKLRLEDDIHSSVGALSGGQQQRTAVGRAIYQDCGVVLGDEPVSAVDEHQARHILETLNEKSRTVGLAMHDRALALAHTTRVIGLRDGKVVMDQPTAGLKPADLDDLYTN